MSNRTIIASCLVLLIGAATFLGTGCGSPSGPGTGVPRVKATFPSNGAEEQNINLTLEWSYSDTTAENIYFDVYLGTSANFQMIRSHLTETELTPGMLTENTAYYWQVRVSDSTRVLATSPVYEFSTGEQFSYPLKIGYWWEYHHTGTYVNIDPPEAAVYLDMPPLDIVQIQVASFDTLNDTLEVFALSTWHVDTTIGWHTYSNISYMNNTDTGLYFYAYDGGSGIMPKPKASPGKLSFGYQGRIFNSLEELTAYGQVPGDWFGKIASPSGIIYEDPPLLVLPYPFEVDMQWTYRVPYQPWAMDKKMLDRVDLETPAGTFDCYEIKWMRDGDNDGEWDDDIVGYDYMSPRGLVGRTWIFRGLKIFHEGSPGVPVGTFDYIENYGLSQFDVQ